MSRGGLAAAAVLIGAVLGSVDNPSAAESSQAGFVGLVPARLVDTRVPGETVDGQARETGPLGADGVLTVPMLGRGGVPGSGVGAVALNVTAINPSAAGFVTVFPAGASRPNASNLNLDVGRTLPNTVIVPLGDGGAISIYNHTGVTDVAVDVLGWFPEGTTGSGPAPINPNPITTSRVSVVTGGAQATSLLGPVSVPDTGGSTDASISADGRYVAFQSDAYDFDGLGSGGSSHVFVHDRHTVTTTRVSVTSSGERANGRSVNPSISADGRYVVFESNARNLADDSHEGFTDHVFVHDRHAGTTHHVSVATDGTPGNHHSSDPSLSADGRYIAFRSHATNLVAGVTNGTDDVFVHDRVEGVTTRVSVGPGGAQADGPSGSPSISGNGRYVAFDSEATNLVPGDTNGVSDVFVHDRHTGVTTRVNLASDGTQADGGPFSNRGSVWPSISADGRYVAFHSLAANLVPGDTNSEWDVFVRDRVAGVTTRVSVTSAGEQVNSGSQRPSISADGRCVAFESWSQDLVPQETHGVVQVYVHDRQTGITGVASVASGGAPAATYHAWRPTISADCGSIAFHSWASNLVPDDTNQVRDVFVFEQAVT